MLKYDIFLIGLLGLGLVFLSLAEAAELNRTLIPLSGPGGKTRGSGNGYFFGSEWATWDEAKQYCQDAGLALLVIETKLKQSVFEQYLDASYTRELEGWNGYAWIAGTDRRSTTGGTGKARFYWSAFSNEKKSMSFYNFASGPDADPGTGCIAISNYDSAAAFGKWYAFGCTATATYFCETIN